MKNKLLIGVSLVILAVVAYAFHVLLVFPLDSVTNISYEINTLAGDFLFFFGGTIVLFVSYFFSALILSKFKFYQAQWAWVYAVISIVTTLILFQTEVYSDNALLWVLKYVDYAVPGLAILVAWVLVKSKWSGDKGSGTL